MDRGIWATWYNLPSQSREAYFEWLHGTYLPGLAAGPGYAWAAHYEVQPPIRDPQGRFSLGRYDGSEIGMGTDFLMLVGAATPHAFFDPSLAQMAEQHDAETKNMLARRIETRTCVFTEEARVDGPEAHQRPAGTTPAPVVQMGSFCMNSIDADFQLAAWYAQDRLVALAAMPGSVGTRKLVSVAGWAKHAILYEFISAEAHWEYFIDGLDEYAGKNLDWSIAVTSATVHAPGSPSVGHRIWPEV